MKKPATCSGCPLETRGEGFSEPNGPADSLICFVGEALGAEEVGPGRPFVGAAGRKLDASILRLGMDRSQVRVGNVISCRPPGNHLSGAGYEHSAIQHCRPNREKLSGHKVYVPLGVIATRTLLSELGGDTYGGKLENWRGYVIPAGSSFIVPTYHPSHLIQGQQRLTGVFLHDIKRAMEVASFGYTHDEVSLVGDPDPDWFAEWATHLSPDCWLACDIETSMKIGLQEDDLDVPVGEITRINFSFHPDQGITVPWDGRYLPTITSLLTSPGIKVFWNEAYDVPILRERAGIPVAGPIYDGMWAWHLLQSNLPKGLGFVSPFYSRLPPWKHLSDSATTYYAAMDAVQTLRCMFGIARDLQRSNQWDTFLRYVVQFDSQVLHPMERAGLLIDSAALLSFQSRLKQEEARIYDVIQQLVPEAALPLLPRDGWKRIPKGYPPEAIITLDRDREILVCSTCGAFDVPPTHLCP